MNDSNSFQQLIDDLRADPLAAARIERESGMLIAVNQLLVQIDELAAAKGWTEEDLAHNSGIRPDLMKKMFTTGDKDIDLESFVSVVQALGGKVQITVS